MRLHGQRVRAVNVVVCWAVSLCLPAELWAVNPAQWSISEATEGEDVFWTSPTAVDLGFPRYAATFAFSRVEVFTFLGGTDVTDQLGDAEGTGAFDSLPITFIDSTYTEPTTNTSATVNVGIDANGFGQVAITDVVLGRFLLFRITSIEVDATLSIRGIVPGDFDGNLLVDELDLLRWESSYGVNADADTNFDGVSDGADFLEWQLYRGSDYTPIVAAIAAIPEPHTWLLALVGALTYVRRRS